MPRERKVKFDFTRRETITAGGGLLAVALAGCTDDDPDEGEPDGDDPDEMEDMDEVEVTEQGLQFFSLSQAEVIRDMTARIYPSDDNGPGALEAGAVYFIDRQLNSPWGNGENWYTDGPFAGVPTYDDDDIDDGDADVEVEWADEEPSLTQGWQYHLMPNEVYVQSIQNVEEFCENEFGSGFPDLSADEQDIVIGALQAGDVDTFDAVTPEDFFLLLRENTLEGMFADPMYGGNRDMVGWRLKNFPGTPGALGSYRETIQDGEYIEIDEPRQMADDVDEIGLDPDGEHSH